MKGEEAMKRTASILLCLLLLGSTVVFADEFNYRDAYSQYAGGYITSTEQHYTTYSVNAPVTVGAGIKIYGYATEVTTGTGYANVKSNHHVSPYYEHTHSKYNY